MSVSLLSHKKCCYLCGTEYGLHKHHIFYGTGKRVISEKWGCWVWLCGIHHNLSNYSVHYNIELDNAIKQDCQRAFESKYSHQDFMQTFKKNYL